MCERLAARHAFADLEEFVQVYIPGYLGASSSRDEHAFHFRQVAFEVVRGTLENGFADYQGKDGIAEEFKTLIAKRPFIDSRGVHKGLRQKLAVGKTITDNLLDLVQNFLFHQIALF